MITLYHNTKYIINHLIIIHRNKLYYAEKQKKEKK